MILSSSPLRQRPLVATCQQPSAHLRSLAGSSPSASCCRAHLVLGDPPGRGVDAKLLQRVDDLAPGADRDRAVEDQIQMADAGILGGEEEEEEGAMSVRKENPLCGFTASVCVCVCVRGLRRQSDNELPLRG